MRLPDLLATRHGRLTAFFFLYVTEGVPLGFAATAVATQLRRQGIGPAEIGAFVASFYLPWAFKWAFGPFVDVFRSKRFGHRRGWILFTQLMMAATLLSLMAVPLPQGLSWFTAILLVHNSFGALQDVAIDSLAINTLHEDERGLANGLMFAGAAIGQAVGGSGVLFMVAYTGFQASFVFVAACILAVTSLVVLPMKEAYVGAVNVLEKSSPGLTNALAAMRLFAIQSFHSFVGSRGAYAAVFFALLPSGAMSLGLALQSNLAVEFGMNDDAVGWLNLVGNVLSAAAMVVGGWLSDKLGRRLTLGLFLGLMSLPVLYLMGVLQAHGYVMARPAGGLPQPLLIHVLWLASLAYNLAQGLSYGTFTALFMDVTTPRVAATQFTAYMALSNLAIAFASSWQGFSVEAWGYPRTLLIDAITGPLCILLLPAMRVAANATTNAADTRAALRARRSAFGLGAACLMWLPYWACREAAGAAQPIIGTLFTLIFVACALFLLAGREVLGQAAGALRGSALWLAPLLMAMYGRYHLNALTAWPAALTLAQSLIYAVPALAGVALLALGTRGWQALADPQAESGGAARIPV